MFDTSFNIKEMVWIEISDQRLYVDKFKVLHPLSTAVTCVDVLSIHINFP